jgi:hypothetical protein
VTREQLLAAEIYGYSFANYQDHLGIGNVRYDQLMPEAVRTLEQAANENWPSSRIAEVLDVEINEAEQLTAAFDRARQIVDAENPAEMFRNAVRFSMTRSRLRSWLHRFVIERLILLSFSSREGSNCLDTRGICERNLASSTTKVISTSRKKPSNNLRIRAARRQQLVGADR